MREYKNLEIQELDMKAKGTIVGSEGNGRGVGQIWRGKYEQGTIIYAHEYIIVKPIILYTKLIKIFLKTSNYFLNMRII